MEKHIASLKKAWFGGEAQDNLARLLAHLRAMLMSYQTSHWVARGDPQYGDHLLFQRLYEALGGEIDSLAEKMVGYINDSSVNLVYQIQLIDGMVNSWSAIPCPFERGLVTETQLQDLLKQTLDSMDATGDTPLGFTDFLPALASAHDTNMYLLQQRLKGHDVKKNI